MNHSSGYSAMPPTTKSRRSFLRAAAGAAAAASLGEALAAPGAGGGGDLLIAYVGTYSAPLHDVLPTQVDLPPGNGRGIHLFQVDRATSALRPAGVQELGTSPSALALNAAGTHLYSANETDRVGPRQEGTVSAFAIGRTDGRLTPLNTVRSGGAGPAHLSVHPAGKHVLVANYFGGSIAVLPIREDGRLGEPTDVKEDAGKVGPTRAASAAPGSFAFSGHDRTHAHQVQADPSGRFVLHVDLGQDRIYVWSFDAVKGTLSPAASPFVSLPPGDGPRHVHFHPNGRWLYSLQEEGSTIVLFDYDGGTGRLTPRQTLSSLPPGYTGSNFCSEILVSSDGKFVYAGNRLHDSIGIFAVGPDGQLRHLADEWTRGNYPRSFSFTPDGEFLYCCNQRADHVTVFRVSRRTGGLQFTGHYVPVGTPSQIVFLDLGKRR
jgi:6-phosphogluconolactonase (cycloisomerase 2 family)